MLTGIRENTQRMHAIGAPVYWRLVGVYTLSAVMAGVAGALLTQTNQFVGLNVLGFEPSGELLVMLILGGGGPPYRPVLRPPPPPVRPGPPPQPVPPKLGIRT